MLKPAALFAIGLTAATSASAGLALRDAPSPQRPDSDCPTSTLNIYFQAHQSELSPEAKSVLASLAVAYLSCDVDRIEINSLAVDAAAPDSTPDIAAARAESIAGIMRFLFFGRTDVVVRVVDAGDSDADEFGPRARRAEIRLVT